MNCSLIEIINEHEKLEITKLKEKLYALNELRRSDFNLCTCRQEDIYNKILIVEEETNMLIEKWLEAKCKKYRLEKSECCQFTNCVDKIEL